MLKGFRPLWRPSDQIMAGPVLTVCMLLFFSSDPRSWTPTGTGSSFGACRSEGTLMRWVGWFSGLSVASVSMVCHFFSWTFSFCVQTAFFRQHGCSTKDTNAKYNSRAAQMYREKIRQLANAALSKYGTEVSRHAERLLMISTLTNTLLFMQSSELHICWRSCFQPVLWSERQKKSFTERSLMNVISECYVSDPCDLSVVHISSQIWGCPTEELSDAFSSKDKVLFTVSNIQPLWRHDHMIVPVLILCSSFAAVDRFSCRRTPPNSRQERHRLFCWAHTGLFTFYFIYINCFHEVA